jgi:hypothetical protein
LSRPFSEASIKQLQGIFRENRYKRVVLGELREELGFRKTRKAKQLLKEVLAVLAGEVVLPPKPVRSSKPEDQFELLSTPKRNRHDSDVSAQAKPAIHQDVIVYHNPDKMPYPATEVTEPGILTNKRVSRNAVGDRIWLLTGEGNPRRFFLRAVFTATDVESGEEHGFRTHIFGKKGKFFQPMIELTDEDWFQDLKRSQGNFAFGYQPITDLRFVRGLESVVARELSQK